MTLPYFNQFKTPVWQPMVTPELLDESWSAVFVEAEPHEQTNIINGWLWLFNERMHNINRNQKFGNILNEARSWLRVALPLSTHEMFVDKGFDGTTKALSYTQNWVDKERERFAAALAKIWFGHGEERVKGVIDMTVLLENQAEFTWRNRSARRNVDYIGNLVENLAWDTVAENPDNLKLHINAAKLSALIARGDSIPPEHPLAENRAWHKLSQSSSSNVHHFTDMFGDNVQHIVHKSHPAVAAAVFPILMKQIPADDRQPNFPYYRKCGVSGLVAKHGAAITDYDILRVWIPSKTSYWDSAEELGVHYEQACEQVTNCYLTQQTATLAVDFSPESI